MYTRMYIYIHRPTYIPTKGKETVPPYPTIPMLIAAAKPQSSTGRLHYEYIYECFLFSKETIPLMRPAVFRSEGGFTVGILLYLLGTPGVVHRYPLGGHRTRCCFRRRRADPVARNNTLWSSWSNSDEFPKELSSAETRRATFWSTAVLNNVAGWYAEDHGSVSPPCRF